MTPPSKTCKRDIFKFSIFGFFLYLKFGESYFTPTLINASCKNISENDFNTTIVNSYIYTNLITAIPIFILIDFYKKVKQATVSSAFFAIFYALFLSFQQVLGANRQLADGVLAEIFASLTLSLEPAFFSYIYFVSASEDAGFLTGLVRAVYSCSQGIAALVSFGLVNGAFNQGQRVDQLLQLQQRDLQDNDTLNFTATTAAPKFEILPFTEGSEIEKFNNEKIYLVLWRLQLLAAILAFITGLMLKTPKADPPNLEEPQQLETQSCHSCEGQPGSLKNYVIKSKRIFLTKSLKFSPVLVAIQFNMGMAFAYSQMVWIKHDNYRENEKYNGLVIALLWLSGGLGSVLAGFGASSTLKFINSKITLQFSLILQVAVFYLVTLNKVLKVDIKLLYFLFMIIYGNGEFLLARICNKILENLTRPEKKRKQKNPLISEITLLSKNELNTNVGAADENEHERQAENLTSYFTSIYAINQYLCFFLMFLVLKVGYFIEPEMSQLVVFRIAAVVTGLLVVMFDCLY